MNATPGPAGQELAAGVRRDVLVREIDVGFDVRERFHEFIAELVDALGKLAGELLVGGAQGQFGAGMDQVGDGFGLGQIDPAVEEGAPGKLPGLGGPRAVLEDRVQDGFGREQAAMTGDFDDVLARERARRAHDGDQHLVHGVAASDDVAKMNGVRFGRGGFRGSAAGGDEAMVGDAQRPRAGEPDHGKAAFSQRGGDRSDGVVNHPGPLAGHTPGSRRRECPRPDRDSVQWAQCPRLFSVSRPSSHRRAFS